MLIALVGPACSGKAEVAQYLIVHHRFRPAIIPSISSLSTEKIKALTSLTPAPADSPTTTHFTTREALLDHATAHWRDNIVTLDLCTAHDLAVGFDKRPSFLLVAVDAPLLVRWQRALIYLFHLRLCRSISLERFIQQDDEPDGKIVSVSAPTSSSLRSLMQNAALTITNPYASISTLHTHLATLSLASPHRLRPSWDTYFLSLCTLASLRSNCMKRRVGAVLVRSNRVLSTGYNGTPRGLTNCNEGGCPRCNAAVAGGTALDECLCLHAEENALLECGRERGGAEGTVLYCNTCPCLRCAVKIVQTGVKEVVYQLAYSMDDRSRTIFREAGVTFRQYQPL
ncbi:hypothetical protein FA10DRAFT_248648 [Acaromyces ingoldii]|uniref:Deoxycytidylate deaminase n=1 Tax=Acaromyces ingoldii TaxID=215250 RepID=A0A316YYE6_9BASI|nr:hypothetical protein FA10DRAFT_248648 [Acaromyces ingoldii]PWN94086.1 hypothetical protein FA10DRAFT_248648 [Acaromyces ingoldii]